VRALRPSPPPAPGAALHDNECRVFASSTRRMHRRHPQPARCGGPLASRSHRRTRTVHRPAASPLLSPSAKPLSCALDVLASVARARGHKPFRNPHNGRVRLSLFRSGGCSGGRTSPSASGSLRGVGATVPRFRPTPTPAACIDPPLGVGHIGERNPDCGRVMDGCFGCQVGARGRVSMALQWPT